jgi:flagellar hook-length control protein FliK
MPQATTTSVSVGPKAELAGPGAPTAGPHKDQPSFDTLLRPAVRNKSAGPTKLVSDLADPARNQAQPTSTEIQPGTLEVKIDGNDPSQPQVEQSTAADVLLIESLAGLAAITPQISAVDAPIVTEEGTDAGDRVIGAAGELATSTVVEHLPNRSAAQATSAAGEPAPTVIGEQMRKNFSDPAPNITGEQALSPPRHTALKPAEARATILETSAPAIAPIANVAQSKPPPDAPVDARLSATSAPAESRTDPSATANQQHPVAATTTIATTAIKTATTEESSSKAKTATAPEQARTTPTVSTVEVANAETLVPSPESPASDLPRLENPSPDAISQSATDWHDQNNNDDDDPNRNENPAPSENPRENKTATMELVAGTQNASAQIQTAPETTSQAPVDSPTASSPAHTESHQAVATAGASTAFASLPSPRVRQPADVLAQPAATSNRRSTPPIDSKSLLTRVTRAFKAAQERDGEIRLRLSPPELGSLRLEIRIQDGAMVAHLQTETEAARSAIVENLPALRERLSDQGVRIERFDVDLMHRQPGGSPDQPGRQQPEAPAAPLRVAPAMRPRASAAPIARPSPAASSTSGLNVIV